MDAITDHMPSDLREYRDAMRTYNLAAARWLGLDPGQVFKLEVDDSRAHGTVVDPPEVRVTWEATAKIEPRVGHWTWAMRGDWDETIYTGAVVVDYPEAMQFVAEVGERPAFPWPANTPADWKV